jgi:cell division protein FtsB
MIPLRLADQAVAACEAELQKLRAENAWLKAEVERLQSIHSIDSIGIEQLKAEVERLTSDLQMEKENEDRLVRERQRANNEVYGLQRQVAALIDDQTRLKAEVTDLKSTADGFKADVERLTKAGDLMMGWIDHQHDDSGYEHSEAWETAKEGKQS